MKRLARWLATAWPRRARAGAHARLRVALVADELTTACLAPECQLIELTPQDGPAQLRRTKPDLLFVESAWQGAGCAWKYRIASYPEHPERDNSALARLVGQARELGIPALFWNREDGVHFDRFIASAKLFPCVFTVDEHCVARYRAALGPGARVGVLPFAVQPAIHSFDGIAPARRGANFVGSYSRHVHPGRRERQDMLLDAAADTLGLTVYDRNSDRRNAVYRYPDRAGIAVRPRVRYEQTAAIYKSHVASLNVNTVEDSPTMFSRRLIEILACGGLAVSTPALAIERMFAGLCHVVDGADAAAALFGRLARDGYDARDRAMMAEGAAHVTAHHTWSHRLDTVLDAIERPAG